MKRFASALALVAGLTVASNASAATITQTFTQPQSATTWSVADIPFNQFNPSLGTLTAVTLGFSGSFTQQEVISVPAGNPTQQITGLSAIADVLIYGAPNFTNQITDINNTQTVLSFPGASIASGTSQTFNAAGNLVYGPTAQTPIAPYIGAGTISFSLAGTGGFSVSGGGQANFSITTMSGGTLTLTYTYDPAITPPPTNGVPEPTTMAGALAGLLVLVPAARRRLAAKA